ncbi:CDP-glycerol glycerophosphotransferase family protein [Brevibacterium casei]|nr:CDP-glycerol glycerophosphotransferase family protein [Brevibacterium casei]
MFPPTTSSRSPTSSSPDYSSIFIDFLGTGRPVLFHLPDAGKYGRERGTYLRPDELPGPVSESIDELLEQATRLAEDEMDLSSAFSEEAARFSELARLTPTR